MKNGSFSDEYVKGRIRPDPAKAPHSAPNGYSSTSFNEARLVLVNGCFDVIHRGHASFLISARLRGDYLVVAVNSDASVKELKGEGRPVSSLENRMYMIAALECVDYVDYVFPFSDTNISKVLERIKPDLWLKGSDYNYHTLNSDEMTAACENRTDLDFIPWVEGLSATGLLDRCERANQK